MKIMEVKETKTFTKVAKQWLHRIFIDGLSGMALGLFATLIVGTILGQIATFDFVAGTFVGNLLTFVANLTKTLMGVGIGVGIAYKFKESPLVTRQWKP